MKTDLATYVVQFILTAVGLVIGYPRLGNVAKKVGEKLVGKLITKLTAFPHLAWRMLATELIVKQNMKKWGKMDYTVFFKGIVGIFSNWTARTIWEAIFGILTLGSRSLLHC